MNPARAQSPTPKQPVLHQLTEKENGSRLSLHHGDRLQLSLAGNPTTGFSWEVDSNDDDLLQEEGQPKYEAEKTNLVGSGGTFIFTFQAIKAGEDALRLVYQRPFEKNTPPEMEFNLTVKIE
jgi:inhibitor of cysteine peptidase